MKRIHLKQYRDQIFLACMLCIAAITIIALIAPIISFALAGLLIHILFLISVVLGIICIVLYW